MDGVRLARALALAGIASRRKCEIHIEKGEVSVNGEVVCDLGRQVDFKRDEICFRGRPLLFDKQVYYLLHKPAGYTTTVSDPHAKKTVFDLLPKSLVPSALKSGHGTRVFPVGRLDRDSTGLLLFTNDGDLANRLTHPRYGIGKWYEVRLHRRFEPLDGKKLLAGIRLEEGMAQVEKCHPLSKRVLRLLIREGKKREIRRIFEKLDYHVLVLRRVAFGPLILGRLQAGEGRFLAPHEIQQLKQWVSETPAPATLPKP